MGALVGPASAGLPLVAGDVDAVEEVAIEVADDWGELRFWDASGSLLRRPHPVGCLIENSVHVSALCDQTNDPVNLCLLIGCSALE